jgi:hypothetical protein
MKRGFLKRLKLNFRVGKNELERILLNVGLFLRNINKLYQIRLGGFRIRLKKTKQKLLSSRVLNISTRFKTERGLNISI